MINLRKDFSGKRKDFFDKLLQAPPKKGSTALNLQDGSLYKFDGKKWVREIV